MVTTEAEPALAAGAPMTMAGPEPLPALMEGMLTVGMLMVGMVMAEAAAALVSLPQPPPMLTPPMHLLMGAAAPLPTLKVEPIWGLEKDMDGMEMLMLLMDMPLPVELLAAMALGAASVGAPKGLGWRGEGGDEEVGGWAAGRDARGILRLECGQERHGGPAQALDWWVTAEARGDAKRAAWSSRSASAPGARHRHEHKREDDSLHHGDNWAGAVAWNARRGGGCEGGWAARCQAEGEARVGNDGLKYWNEMRPEKNPPTLRASSVPGRANSW